MATVRQLTLGDEEFNLLRQYIRQHCGINLSDDKRYLVAHRLGDLVQETGCESYADFCRMASAGGALNLRDRIIDAMTTNETLWFRGGFPFSILREELLPRYDNELAEGKRREVRIWSAACSTGQEPYSIAMTIQEYLPQAKAMRPEHIVIDATDISASALEAARTAIYDNCAISRGLSDEMRDRYFTSTGHQWKLNEKITQMVRFSPMNLQHSFGHLAPQDIIFCRNVLIYFDDEFKSDVLGRMYDILNPGGALILGCSESLFGISDDYQLVSTTQGRYYSRP